MIYRRQAELAGESVGWLVCDQVKEDLRSYLPNLPVYVFNVTCQADCILNLPATYITRLSDVFDVTAAQKR